ATENMFTHWLMMTGQSGAGNSTAKHRNARFLFNFFGGVKPENNVIPRPPQEDPPAKKICTNLCQKGWISYRGHCYMLIQERMTWLEAEVLGCSKQECLLFLPFFSHIYLSCA
uniref:Uncharacterized protein n=1 Tax=Coturnix japonica TaxID=93934 RepID=A0A8C2UDZ2_COTJA